MLKTSEGRMIPCFCITNRKLCQDDFIERIKRIVDGQKADAVILREKDLPEGEYLYLAGQVLDICQDASIPCILHTFYRAAAELGCRRIHLPFDVLMELKSGQTAQSEFDLDAHFEVVGTSVHSEEQAKRAAPLGIRYLIAGHIFETDCKMGVPGRGLGFVKNVSQVPVPVYAIGGIHRHNAADVVNAGASGVCMMSSFMLDALSDL